MATRRPLQYIPRNMHTVFALMCFVVVIHWLIFPYPSGLLHWHCGNLTIAPVPAKQPWWIWINTSCELIINDCITTTKQSTTKPCAYFLGYTVCLGKHVSTPLHHQITTLWKSLQLTIHSRLLMVPSAFLSNCNSFEDVKPEMKSTDIQSNNVLQWNDSDKAHPDLHETSWQEIAFHITNPLWGESIGYLWIPLTLVGL